MKSDATRFHGLFYSGAGEAHRRAELVRALLGAELATIVDVSAGVGDMVLELARAGHQVLGFEPCADSFAVAFDRYAREREIRHLLTLLPMRFEDYPLDPGADAVLASNHWSHLQDAQKLPLLRRAHAGLRPGGLLIMNCAQPTPLRTDQPWAEIQKRVFGEMTIRHFASSTAVGDGTTQRVRFEYRIEHRGELVHTEASETVLTLDAPARVRALLAEARFDDVRVRGGYSDTEYSDELPGFVVIARKSGDERPVAP